MKLLKEEDKDHKTLSKENKRLQIFIIIFMVIAICLGTFYFNVICFGTDCENKTPKPLIIINPNKTSDNAETAKENKNNEISWGNYLLNQHILEAKIIRVRNTDLGDTEDFNKTVTLTMDDVKELISKLENNKLSKVWSEGRGGPERDYLIISYEKNGQKYAFEIYYDDIAVDKLDDEFKEILDKNKYEEKNTEYRGIPGSFYFYDIENFSETIFDKYFN